MSRDALWRNDPRGLAVRECSGILAPEQPVHESERYDKRAMATPSGPQNVAALAAGFGIGIVWVVFAVTALLSAARGYANGRLDWGIGWGLVGVLLLAAGIAAMVGTWWHQTRVMKDREH